MNLYDTENESHACCDPDAEYVAEQEMLDIEDGNDAGCGVAAKDRASQ